MIRALYGITNAGDYWGVIIDGHVRYDLDMKNIETDSSLYMKIKKMIYKFYSAASSTIVYWAVMRNSNILQNKRSPCLNPGFANGIMSNS